MVNVSGDIKVSIANRKRSMRVLLYRDEFDYYHLIKFVPVQHHSHTPSLVENVQNII